MQATGSAGGLDLVGVFDILNELDLSCVNKNVSKEGNDHKYTVDDDKQINNVVRKAGEHDHNNKGKKQHSSTDLSG